MLFHETRGRFPPGLGTGWGWWGGGGGGEEIGCHSTAFGLSSNGLHFLWCSDNQMVVYFILQSTAVTLN